MKILLISDNHILTGGAEKYFFELKNRLKNIPGIQVHSLGFASQENVGEDFVIFKAATSKIAKLIGRICLHPILYFKLKKQIKQFNPDIIHLHNIKQYPVSLYRAIRDYPIVQTVHDFSWICPLGQNIHQDLSICERGFNLRCFWQHRIKYHPFVYLSLVYAFYKLRFSFKKIIKQFIAPSPFLADYLTKHDFPTTCILPFQGVNSTYHFDTIHPNHFLFVGSISRHKGIHVLIDEFTLATQKNKNLILFIAGEGSAIPYLQRRIKKLQLENNIIFLGWQSDLQKYYQQCAALIFPSTGLESFGLVMTEAMSHARPVIGVNRGTAAWLIEDNHTGLLFDPLKNADLAEKILFIAKHPEHAQYLGKNAHKKVHQLMNNEENLQKIIHLYTEIIKKSTASSLKKNPRINVRTLLSFLTKTYHT